MLSRPPIHCLWRNQRIRSTYYPYITLLPHTKQPTEAAAMIGLEWHLIRQPGVIRVLIGCWNCAVCDTCSVSWLEWSFCVNVPHIQLWARQGWGSTCAVQCTSSATKQYLFKSSYCSVPIRQPLIQHCGCELFTRLQKTHKAIENTTTIPPVDGVLTTVVQFP